MKRYSEHDEAVCGLMIAAHCAGWDAQREACLTPSQKRADLILWWPGVIPFRRIAPMYLIEVKTSIFRRSAAVAAVNQVTDYREILGAPQVETWVVASDMHPNASTWCDTGGVSILTFEDARNRIMAGLS